MEDNNKYIDLNRIKKRKKEKGIDTDYSKGRKDYPKSIRDYAKGVKGYPTAESEYGVRKKLGNERKYDIHSLYEKTSEEMILDSRISLTSEKNSFRLKLDRGAGFGEYEDFTVEQGEILFEAQYRALQNTALETFSEKSNLYHLINDSRILTNFQKKFNKNPPTEGYEHLLILRERGNFWDMNKATDFFLKAFKSKISS